MHIDNGLLERITQIAESAGKEIMEIYARDFSVEEKDDKSPLTEADSAAHARISLALQEIGDVPVLSEEDVAGFAGADDDGRYWLVDPLDGTKEFIKKNGEFTVNIALIEDGRPVLGVVHAPALGRTYQGWAGQGAWRIDANGVREIRVVDDGHDGPWRVVGSRSHASPKMADWLAALGEHEMVPMGSSLKLCLVAEGAADVYPRLGPTSLWDTGAAQAVVEAAGGRVIAPDRRTLDYADTSEVLNPHFLAFGKRIVDWPEFGE